jgi:MFS family permease
MVGHRSIQPSRRPDRFLELSKDGWLLFASCGVRSFAYGFLSVVLGLYLAAVGFGIGAIGGIFTAALAGGAVMTVLLSTIADQFGRRRILMVGAALMALAGVVFAVSDSLILLAAAAVLGTISPSGKEVGPFLSVEQAMLPQTTGDEHRTTIFAAYNLVGSLAGALGALAVSVPSLFGLSQLEGYRLLVWGYVFAALILFLLFGSLSLEVEVTGIIPSTKRQGFGVHRSSGVVAKLATLFAIDSFAGGFIVQSLVAYWFYLRYGVDTKALGSIFFGANFLAALSFLLAAPISKRIGLLNTMVSTHLLSNILLLLVPFMPNLQLTIGVFLVRHLLSQLDVPTRQSYTIAIVDPDERSAAAGITSVARNAAAAVAPAFTGWMLTVPAVGWPFLIAGGLKIVYDLLIFTLFRNVRPPEEVARSGAAITTSKSRFVS